MATDCLSTDDFGQEQQDTLDAIADLIEAAHRLPDACRNGSIDRQILERAHEAYDTLCMVMTDDMVGGRPIDPLPPLTPDEDTVIAAEGRRP